MFAWLKARSTSSRSAAVARGRLIEALGRDRVQCAPAWDKLRCDLTALFGQYAELDGDGLQLLMGRRRIDGKAVLTASITVRAFKAAAAKPGRE